MPKYINADEFIREYNRIDLTPYINKGYAQQIDGYEMWEKWKIEFDQNVRRIVARLLTEREDEDKIIARIKDIPIMPVPSADVVEVVRCRDCVHKKARNPIYVNEGRVYCLKFGQYMLNEGFCSYGKKPEYLFFGERKDNETET